MDASATPKLQRRMQQKRPLQNNPPLSRQNNTKRTGRFSTRTGPNKGMTQWGLSRTLSLRRMLKWKWGHHHHFAQIQGAAINHRYNINYSYISVYLWHVHIFEQDMSDDDKGQNEADVEITSISDRTDSVVCNVFRLGYFCH